MNKILAKNTDHAKIRKRKAAVLMIDMQENFLRNIISDERERITANQEKVLGHCTLCDIPVVALRWRGEGPIIGRLMEKARNVPRLCVLAKNDKDGFADPRLRIILYILQVKTVMLMGVNADACVRDTAIGAKCFDFKIMTSEDLIAGRPHHSHDKSAGWYKRFGIFARDYRELLEKIC